MTAYAFAHLRRAPVHDDLLDYMDRIQGTLDPFSGRFLVHGGRIEVIEGEWPGDVVIIEFPDMAMARSWYDSSAYQELVPLRTRHLRGEVILVEGVPPDYHPAQKATGIRARQQNVGA